MASNRSAPSLAATLIRPTPPREPEPEQEPQTTADAGSQEESRGATESKPTPARSRRRRMVAGEKTSKRGLVLSEALWERLQLESIRRRMTISQLVEDTMTRAIPKLRIERDA